MKLKSFAIVIFAVSLLLPSLGLSKEKASVLRRKQHRTNGALAKSALDGPTRSIVNINNITSWVGRDGHYSHWYNNTWNGSFPKGTAGVVYNEGIVWGVIISDDDPISPRVGGSTYDNGLQGGKVRGWTANPYTPPTGTDAHEEQQVWRVRVGYETADLSADAASFNEISIDDVSQGDMDELRDQYAHDWENWPAVDGAPFDDVDSNRVYNPSIDIPGFPGASQTVWLVANDLDPDISAIPYGSPSIGLEMQISMWAYDYAATHPLGNIIFKKVRLIYTGKIGSTADAHIDTMYLTQWSDVDLGTYTDDYVGTDIDASLGYIYNGNVLDTKYYGEFSLPVPAAGYDFLQGPIVPDSAGLMDTLGMSSFVYFGASSVVDDPDLGEYEGTLQWFNLMEGFLPRPAYPAQSPFLDPLTGGATNYALSGDPVTGTGWIDGIVLPPGDRRIVMTTGPFEMALGDTQDIVIALIAGMGQDNLSSVTVMKYYDTFAQYAYDNNFILPSPPVGPDVVEKGLDGEIVLNWGLNTDKIAETEDTINMGFAFEGYNVYQLPTAASGLSEAVKVATYDRMNLVQTIFDPGVDPQSGFIVDQPKQSGTNSGVQRYFSTSRDAVRSRPMSNGIAYYFAITAYNYLEDNEEAPFKTLESSPVVVAVTPQSPVPGTAYGDEHGHLMTAAHSAGLADGEVTIRVINPADLTGDAYELFFDRQLYYRDQDGIWNFANADSSIPKVLGKAVDVSPSTVTGAAIFSPNLGTIDLVFNLDLVSPDGDWADGFKLTLPAGIGITSATAAGMYGSYTDQGQVCDNIPDGLIDQSTNTIFWGDSTRSSFGCIEGAMTFTVNVATFSPPISVDYQLYDDGYGGNIVDAAGTINLAEIGYEFKTENHWNLRNLTSGDAVLEDQTVINGTDVYTNANIGPNASPIIQGFQPNVIVNYAAPVTTGSMTITGDGSYNIDTYYENSWASTAKAIDAFGSGTEDINILQRDIEVRFTGEYDDPITVNGMTVHPIREGTGSIATIDGARMYDLADHPMNPNPGSDELFAIRIPFEVWDLDADGGPQQIDVTIYDRIQEVSPDSEFYAFNTDGRMYVHWIFKEYSEEVADLEGADADNLTWNTVWWEADWELGDAIVFQYDNPIQLGVDVFTFQTSEPTIGDNTLAVADVERINVFPNPYLGVHEIETNRFDKYVTFNHLPERATIRFFNLGGVMVRVINKDDESQFTRWDLKNQSGYPVASGIYLAHIEMPDLNKTKILKLAIVQEEQILLNY